MEKSFNNILITGGTRGLGYAIAEKFARAGYKVAIAGRDLDRTLEKAALLAKDCNAQVVGVCGDIASPPGAQQVFAKAREELGVIDILVNNAGLTRDNLLLRMKPEDWDLVLSTNLTALYHLTKLALKDMLRAGGGRIINIASVVGQTGNPGQTNYAASKGGMIAFTKALAREVAAKAITVNAIAPGYIETDMTAVLDEKVREQLLATIPLKRFGATHEIAAATYFLASQEAAYITGQVLAVNGGMYM
ncbi:3-oxoacyl-[acyl-carrier-protein] reductase FabG [Spirochaetota bacterium]|nr:3-oxoacyl-[acyl-carrier-protein] reductase FabG [Spirochaetota bacterium]